MDIIDNSTDIYNAFQSACQNRVNRWEGCTVIDGDLILIQCQGREFDFSGLQDIGFKTYYTLNFGVFNLNPIIRILSL